MQYRGEIDGLRALAILPVVFYHFGVSAFSGGYLGVDVFFVISGYLITNIILNELEDGSFTLANFYERRARRILPALFFVLFTTLLMAAVWLNPVDKIAFMKSFGAASTFTSNILFWFESGYFDTEAELKPLLHTWSLAVEGQYYLLFPLLLLALCRYGDETILIGLVLLCTTSLALAHYGAYHFPQTTFYLLPTRLWEILLGSFCAFYLRSPKCLDSTILNQIGSITGLVLISYAVLAFDTATPTPSLYTLVPTLGTVMVILCAQPNTLVHKLLNTTPCVGIGLISYSLYLWHYPLLSFLKHITLGMHGELELMVVLAIACVLALITYQWVELPFRRKAKVTKKTVLGLPVLVSVILISGASYTLLDHRELQQRAQTESKKYITAMKDWAYPHGLERGPYQYSFVTHPGFDIHTLFIGDSHAQQYTPLLTSAQAMLHPTMLFSGGGCAPIPNVFENNNLRCHRFIEQFKVILHENPSIQKIVIAGCFNCYFVEHTKPWNQQYNYYYRHEGEPSYFRDGDGKEPAIASFTQFVSALSEDYELVVILDNPSSAQFDPKIALAAVETASQSYFAKKYPDYSPNSFAHSPAQIALANELKDALADLDITLIDPAPIVCPNHRCNAQDENGAPIYKDAHHIRPFFVNARFDVLREQLERPTPSD